MYKHPGMLTANLTAQHRSSTDLAARQKGLPRSGIGRTAQKLSSSVSSRKPWFSFKRKEEDVVAPSYVEHSSRLHVY